MKENQKLKLQSGQMPSLPSESQEEALRTKYEEALEDIRQLRANVEQMRKLLDEQGVRS
jgi:hypothetical protein